MATETGLQKGKYYYCSGCGNTAHVTQLPCHAQCGHSDGQQIEISGAEYLERHFGSPYGELPKDYQRNRA